MHTAQWSLQTMCEVSYASRSPYSHPGISVWSTHRCVVGRTFPCVWWSSCWRRWCGPGCPHHEAPTSTPPSQHDTRRIQLCNNRNYSETRIGCIWDERKRKLRAIAKKRVAAGAHLPNSWLLSLRNAQTIKPTAWASCPKSILYTMEYM